MRAIKDVKETFFVRAELDSDRVDFFVKLLTAGEKLPPLKITKRTTELQDGELIDGRHRKAAYERMQRTQVPVLVDPSVLTREQAILAAFAANVGGAQPPKDRDYSHTVLILLKSGLRPGHVARKLHEATRIPLAIFKRYVDNVQSTLAKQRMNQARAAIADKGLSVKEAAQEFDVDPVKLRAELRGKKKKETISALSEFKSGITARFKAFSAVNGKLPGKLRDLHDSGEMKTAEVEAVLQHYGMKLQDLSLQYRNWLVRFEKDGVTKHKKK
jgi:hypothetical protein